MAQRSYEVFHIVIREGYAGHGLDAVLRTWKPLLPERTLILDDYTRIAELVVSAIEINEGRDSRRCRGQLGRSGSAVVAKAIEGMTPPRGFRPVLPLIPSVRSHGSGPFKEAEHDYHQGKGRHRRRIWR